MAVLGNTPSVSLDHILMATDFTAASETALAYAGAFAKRFSSRVTVANVVDLSAAARTKEVALAVPLDEMRRDSAENIERVISHGMADGLEVQGKLLEAHSPAAGILGLAEEIGADLLVIGTHDRKGVHKFILGSFAQEVIHQAKCPVLTIGPCVKPPEGKPLNFYTVLFATDLHHDTSAKVAVALAFAEDSLARIVMCHVVNNPSLCLANALDQQFQVEAALRKLIPNAAYDWCSPELEVQYGDPATRILRLSEREAADLIVLGARCGSSWLGHFFQGTVGHVIAHARCPVMTLCSEPDTHTK